MIDPRIVPKIFPGIVLAFFLALFLAGCAVPDQQQGDASSLRPAERVARMLSGSYAGIPGSVDGAGNGPGRVVRLDARVERFAAQGVQVRLNQKESGEDARAFLMTFQPTAVGTRLEGSFSPLGSQGQPLGSCPIDVSVQSDGFVARTSAETCRFGEGGEATALVKEIAHDGERLVIGDRIVDLETGQVRMSDRVLELQRIRRFEGWAGVRAPATGGEAWRIADELALESDGQELAPEDAGGMPLEIAIELAPYRVRDDQPPVLRLRVFDRSTGDLLGQSWADFAATRIGLALPQVQVGLRLRESR